MYRRWMFAPLFAVCFLATVLWVSGAWATPASEWFTGSGSIFNAKMLPDGSHVDLILEDIIKIKDTHIVIAEPFRSQDRLILLTVPDHLLRLGQVIDVSGYLTTLPSGERALLNVTIQGYASADTGELLYHPGIIKIFSGTEQQSWPWKVDLTADSVASMSSAASVSTSSELPNSDPAEGPTYYSKISDLREEATTQTQSVRVQSYYDGIPDLEELPAGSLVELQCKRITGVGTEIIDSVTYKYLDIAEDLPATDTIRCYYSAGTPTTGDRVNRVTGQIQYTNGGTVQVICIDDGPDYNPQTLVGLLNTASPNTVPYIWTQANGASASLTGKVVTANQTDFPGALYVQEPSGSGSFGGIRVMYSGSTIPRGNLVSVTGTVALDSDGERKITNASVTSTGSTTVPGPLGMPNKILGCGDFNIYTPGVNYPTGSGTGLYNKGILVKTWGRVTGVDQETKCFYVDDGSGIDDGWGLRGVRVSWGWPGKSSITPPAQGSYVAVIGISGSSNLGNEHIVRTIRLRDGSDVTSYTDSSSSCQLDRTLPAGSINKAAGADRCNIRWVNTAANVGCGDDFTLPSGQWIIDTIRVWVVPDIPASSFYNFGDHFQSITLYKGGVAGTLTEAASGTFTPGTSGTDNPNISFVRTSYQNTTEKNYQGADGTYSRMWQVEFSNLGWAVTGGTNYVFGIRAVPKVDRQMFLHATHWSSQGDGYVRRFDTTNLAGGTNVVSGSAWFGGKGSDINVQVFAHPQ